MTSHRRLLVLVNGLPGGDLDRRARHLFELLGHRYAVTYLYRESRRPLAFLHFVRHLLAVSPDLAYVVNCGVAPAGAAIAARLTRRTPFVLETGDVGYALARARGRPGWIGAQLIRFVEFASLRLAAAVVVRGTFHKDLLAQQGVASVHVLREGIDLDFWRRTDDTPLRRRLDLGDNLCVGVAGSINWNRRRGVCYGWDLIEAMGRIEPTVPIRAIVVGDGDGLPRLQRRARKLGIEGRVRFVGRVPHDEMPQYLSLFDVALSTQTNDVVGRVRTTQKLPEYMAAGCYVLATDVGEARLLLPPEMRLPFDGVEDAAYPERLARRLEELASLGRQRLREETLEIVERARTELDFRVLSVQLAEILDEVRHGGRADSGTPVAEEAA